MKDRQPYPGKEGLMKHTPCDASGVPTGAPAYYAKVDMADSPLEIGTSFSKANILSDTTAAKLNGVETPNAAFDLLSRFHAGMGNEYVWQRSDGVYVNSTVSNAYPPTPPDGYTYTPLGQIGNKVQIATGSYTGTGTSGVGNPITISFGIDAKILILMPQRTSEETYGITPIVIPAVKSIPSVGILLGTHGPVYLSLRRAPDDTSGNTSLKFYCVEQQDAGYLNPSGMAVSWVAIGQGDRVL